MKLFNNALTRSFARTLLISAGSCFFLQDATELQAGFNIEHLQPVSGKPGDVISISGQNFDPGATWTVTLSGQSFSPQQVTASNIDFVVPSGAQSGTVTIDDGQQSNNVAMPFEVTRDISGRLALPPGISGDGWTVVTGEGFFSVSTNGSFVATVPLDLPGMIWAVRSGSDPAYMTLVVPTDTSATINAGSSAASLIYLVPGIAPADPDQTPQVWQAIRQNPNLSAVTAIIETAAGHYDYLDDSRLVDREAKVAQSLDVSSVTPMISNARFKSGTPSGTKLLDLYPPPNPDPVFAFDPVLNSKLEIDSPNTNNLLFTYDEAREPSLDYIIEIFPLPPEQFTEGFSSMSMLTGQSNYLFYEDHPIPYATGFLRAKLAGRKLDWFGAVLNAIVGLPTKLSDPYFKPNQFKFHRDDSGVFVAQAYSGNIWYGLDKTEYGQANILNQIDPDGQWARTLGENIVLSALDVAGIFINIKEITGIDEADYLDSLIKDTSKALLAYRSNNGVSADEVYDLTKTVAGSIIKKFLERKTKGQAVEAFGEHTVKTIEHSLDVLKKIGSGLNAAERTFNLVSSKNLAVEQAIFVVGDPFNPYITRIAPDQGRESNTFQIFGNNLYVFGDPLPTVEFCTFQSTTTHPDNPPLAARLAAQVLDARPNRITAEVPSGWQTNFNTLDAYVSVTQAGKTNSGYSLHLGDAGLFHYLPPPGIVSVEPEKILPGTHFVIKGTNFTSDCQVLVDNYYQLQIVQIDSNQISVVFPNQAFIGERSLTVKCGAATSDPFPVTIGLPPYTPNSLGSGLDITVTKLDMSNVADGQISLLEAFLIANGGLGRPIEVHDPCEQIAPGEPGYCGGYQQRETDFVSGDNQYGQGGGPAESDTITVKASLHGSSMALTQKLPTIADNDTFNLGDIILDGTGASGGGAALTFDGTADATVQHLVINNWPGDGVQIVNESHGNSVKNITISGATGDGVFISNLCSNNTLISFAIDNVSGTGIHLEGDSSRNQISQGVVNFPGQHGIQLETRCTLNEFSSITNQGAGGDGFRIEGGSDNNHLSSIGIATATGAGLRINGSSYNNMFSGRGSAFTDQDAIFHPHSRILNGQDWGVIVENGSKYNVLSAQVVGQNAAGGILIRGAGTDYNMFGKPYADRSGAYENPIFPMIADNSGPGVCIQEGASHNSLICLNVAGNHGDGIDVSGPGTDDNQLRTILTGFRYFIKDSDPQPAPNQGNSISITNGARNTWITRFVHGAKTVSSGPDMFNTSLALDTGNGILIDGTNTMGTRVDSTTIGSSADTSPFFTNPTNSFAMYPIGSNGIAITGGSVSNIIGKADVDDQLSIDACPQAGILVQGPGCDHNLLSGIAIGNLEVYYDYASDPASHCQYGILLKDGPKDNQIGLPGPMTGSDSFSYDHLVHNVNRISSCDVAGIALDNCGGFIASDGSRQQPNVLKNNYLYGDEVGLLLTHGAQVNDIGGRLHGPRGFGNVFETVVIDENQFGGCHTADIRIHDNVLPDALHQNHFENNTISGNVEAYTNGPVDPMVAPPAGVGLLIDGNSSNNIVGESFSELQNSISFCPVAVYINNAKQNVVRGFDLEGYSYDPLGVVVHNGTGNQIGGDTWGERNEIIGWGTASSSENDGILLTGGGNNTIINNLISSGTTNGIHLYNSTGNQIGKGIGQANQILNNGGDGILVDQNSDGNLICGNYIGADIAGSAAGNQGNGIRFASGAHDNSVGTGTPAILAGNAARIPGANVIANNGAYGVDVDGNTTVGNTLLNNSIYDNSAGGIQNVNGGNEEIHPPINMVLGHDTLVGHVNSLAETPAGSIVQAFTDDGLQGEVLLNGQTVVKADGSWEMTALSPVIFSNVTVTVTSSSSGSTSEFAPVTSTSSFTVARTGNAAPGAQSVIFGSGPIVVLPVTALAVGRPVIVKNVTVNAGGSLADDTAVDGVQLFRDVNTNGVLDSADALIGEAAGFNTNNGLAVINTGSLLMDSGVPQQWLVVYQTSQSVTAGTTFHAQITDTTAVQAKYQFPIGQPAVALGAFPIRSDDFTVQAGSVHPFDDWREINFPNSTNNLAISGAAADPDGDGIPNLLEYAAGLDPNLPDAENLLQGHVEGDYFALEFHHWKAATGIQILPDWSDDLTTWNGESPYFVQPPLVTDDGNGYETMKFLSALPLSSSSDLFLRLAVELTTSP